MTILNQIPKNQNSPLLYNWGRARCTELTRLFTIRTENGHAPLHPLKIM